MQFHAQFVKVIDVRFFIMIPLTEGNERREWSAKYMIEWIELFIGRKYSYSTCVDLSWVPYIREQSNHKCKILVPAWARAIFFIFQTKTLIQLSTNIAFRRFHKWIRKIFYFPGLCSFLYFSELVTSFFHRFSVWNLEIISLPQSLDLF